MLTSLAFIFLMGLAMGSLFQKLKLPPLCGMMITGILLGPYVLNVLDGSILGISADLRQLALVIILTRAGLSLDIGDLKKVGRSAVLMCFLPACAEIAVVTAVGPLLFPITSAEAALMGCVLAAISPAVVVPRMLRLMEEGYGTNKSIPQLILAGASVDDIFVIVLFTASCSLADGTSVSPFTLLQIPVSIVTGLLLGVLVGIAFSFVFQRIHLRDSSKVLILLSLSCLMIGFEKLVAPYVSVSGLLAIMGCGITLCKMNPNLAGRLSVKYNKLWVAAEILLFVLVGATVDIQYAAAAGPLAILLVLIGLIGRMVGVSLCVARSSLSLKERIYTMIAYTPKATVQAAIGGIPLAMGLSCGSLVLTVAVISILITAPFGAFFMDRTYKKLLQKQ